MRILGMAKEFDKLKKPSFIDFRLRRRDRDWQVGEVVQAVLHPRSKERVILGVAEIVKKELCGFPASDCATRSITEKEAREAGFDTRGNMFNWFLKVHGGRILTEPLNKLTLEWVEREAGQK